MTPEEQQAHAAATAALEAARAQAAADLAAAQEAAARLAELTRGQQ
ncbi:hypothetical protein AB0L71_28135 [Streptomyces sp. NPDC052052]